MAKFIGNRCIPTPEGKWDKTKEYLGLSVVLDEKTGDSYTSKKVVPAGTELTNKDYWALSGQYNAQMALIKLQLEAMQNIPEGGTTADAALENIRIGADGTEYATPGDAVRGQVGALSEEIAGIEDKFVIKECFATIKDFTEIGYWVDDKHGNVIANTTDVSTLRYSKVLPGGTYTFGMCRAVLSYTKDSVTGSISQLSATDGNKQITISMKNEFTLYITCGPQAAYRSFLLVNDNVLPTQVTEKGIYETSVLGINLTELKNAIEKVSSSITTHNTITVSKEGNGDYTDIVSAVNAVKKRGDSSLTNQYDIHIFDGTYDIIEELGGKTFLDKITDISSNSSGLVLPNGVNLIGTEAGTVVIKGEIPLEYATLTNTTKISTINVMNGNILKNITITARNMRYAVHDETGNYPLYRAVRKLENCNIIHYGNADGLWESTKAYACGTGLNKGIYRFINCIFKSKKTAFSMHNNRNQPANDILIDGCEFITGSKTALYFSSLGENTEQNVVHIKTMYTNGDFKLQFETSDITAFKAWEIRNYTKYEYIDAYGN